ncbi:endonuclease V [Enterovirga rhinocerotis]|uniref:Endonuclease V n=1 Tax=Enterovirga rhinocerotis TaxID=1339210 RepID=A0A4R7BQQ5_9HYPH|nr:endonuclease V [Enterovirga rhinocerotis]TDR87958.1 endonuclease V [Enterovirga rhinocerotis]
MILAVDVDYGTAGGAVAAGLLFDDWGAARADRVIIRTLDEVGEYRPGRFFERELPCILAVLEDAEAPELIIVDGYAWLGAERKPGLGARLHGLVGLPVIGVAKTPFAGTPADAAVLRGRSSKPLFVTAAGMDETLARARVAAMHGPHRVPTLLRAVDRACRTGWIERQPHGAAD